MPVFAALRHAAVTTPHAVAVRDSHETLSWLDLLGRVGAGAAALRARGLRPGDRVTIDQSRALDALLWFLAADATGLSALITAPGWSASERAHVDNQVRAHAVLDRPAPAEAAELPADAGTEQRSLFYIGATSGSSAAPKLITRDRASWRHSFPPFTAAFTASDADVMLVPGPLATSTFLFAALHALHCGMEALLADSWSPTRALDWCEHATVTHLVPGMLAALAHGWAHDEDARRACTLRTILCCGAKLGSALEQRVHRLLPDCQLVEYYGSAEHSLVSIRDGGDPKTVGFPANNVDIEVSDEDGNPVPSAVEGTIWVRSPMLFSGYLAEGELDSPVSGGWHSNGDRGVLRDDGALEIRSRIGQSVINTGGHNVSAAEVETVLREAPGVGEAVVVGTEHSRLGALVTAIIQPEPDTWLDLAELRWFTASRLSPPKRPRRWWQTTNLPRTTSGKVARAELARVLASDTGSVPLEPLR